MQRFRSALPLALSIAAFLFAIVGTEYGLVFFYRTLPPAAKENARILHHFEVLQSPESYDVIVLGDSSAGGMKTELFHSLTMRSSAEAGTVFSASGFLDPLFLRRYLRTHKHPSAIFVLRSPPMWAVGQRKDLLREYAFTPFAVMNAFPRFPFPLEELSQSYAASLFSSFQNIASMRRRMFVKDSMSSLHANKPEFPADEELDEWNAQAGDPRPENILSLKTLCRIVEEHRIPTFISVAPSGYKNHGEIEQHVASIFDDGSDYCTYFPLPKLSRAFLQDPPHVNASGAILVTQASAEKFLTMFPRSESH